MIHGSKATDIPADNTDTQLRKSLTVKPMTLISWLLFLIITLALGLRRFLFHAIVYVIYLSQLALIVRHLCASHGCAAQLTPCVLMIHQVIWGGGHKKKNRNHQVFPQESPPRGFTWLWEHCYFLQQLL